MSPLRHHFVPHHFNGYQRRAYGLSLIALFIYFQFMVIFGVIVFSFKKSTDVLGATIFPATEIIEFTNLKRKQNGSSLLFENALLSKAAQSKAEDMLANDYWAHYSPQGKSPWVFINQHGYKYTYAGENLARDFEDAKSVVEAWMNSPSHKNNLLDNNFKEIGVAVVSGKLGGKEGILVVQMFGASPSTPTGQAPLAPDSKVAGKQTVSVESGKVTASGNFSKYISLGLVGFIFMLFAIELVFCLKYAHLTLRSSVIAHLAVLGFVLFVLWYSTAGAVI